MQPRQFWERDADFFFYHKISEYFTLLDSIQRNNEMVIRNCITILFHGSKYIKYRRELCDDQ